MRKLRLRAEIQIIFYKITRPNEKKIAFKFHHVTKYKTIIDNNSPQKKAVVQ